MGSLLAYNFSTLSLFLLFLQLVSPALLGIFSMLIRSYNWSDGHMSSTSSSLASYIGSNSIPLAIRASIMIRINLSSLIPLIS